MPVRCQRFDQESGCLLNWLPNEFQVNSSGFHTVQAPKWGETVMRDSERDREKSGDRLAGF